MPQVYVGAGTSPTRAMIKTTRKLAANPKGDNYALPPGTEHLVP